MKSRTKILIVAFVVAVAVLYVVIYLVPKVRGFTVATTLLEYGDLPVGDQVEVCFIRTENLYLANSSGMVKRKAQEGTKVRTGIKIASVTKKPGFNGGSSPSDAAAAGSVAYMKGQPATSENGYDEILRLAAGAGRYSPGYVAGGSAVASYYADGYESKADPTHIDTMTYADMEKMPAEATPLDREFVRAGDPLYKLTNNDVWYMVFWLRGKSNTGDIVNYEKGKSVTVDFGGSEASANVFKIIQDGQDWKVVLRSDMYYKDMAIYRRKPAKVVTDEIRGLIIDMASIAVKDKQPGVFVKQLSGSFKWVPVSITKSYGQKCTIAVGTFIDPKSGRQESTVNYYDEILSDPKAAGYE